MIDVTLSGRAFHFLKSNEEEFLDQVKPYGYSKHIYSGMFDLTLVHDEFNEVELHNDEYFVIFPDNSSEYISYGDLVRKYQL